MTAWSKTFTNIDDVNNGQEFEDTDYPTKEAFNVALNNTQALKERADAKTITIIGSGTTKKAIITKSGLYAVNVKSTQFTTGDIYSTVVSVDLSTLDTLSYGSVIYALINAHLTNDFPGYVRVGKNSNNEYQINLLASYFEMIDVKLIVEY